MIRCFTRQALTEVSVLADMLHIVHDHRHYMAMDPVVPHPPPPIPLAYQYLVKKKVYRNTLSVYRRHVTCSLDSHVRLWLQVYDNLSV